MQRFFSTFSQLLQLFPHLEFERAARQQARQEAEIGVRFPGRNKLVHLIGLGKVEPGRSAMTSPIRNHAALVCA